MATNFRRSTPADQLASGVTQGQNFRRGFVQNEELENEIGRQSQFRQLTGQILDPSLPAEQRFEAERQRAIADPFAANRLTVADVGKDKARDQAFLQSVVTGAAQINAIPSTEGKLAAALSRKQALVRQNMPTDETDELIGLLQSGDEQGAQALLDQGIQLGVQSGILKSPKGASAVRVQSSNQLPGGLVQLVMTDGTIQNVTPSEADAIAVKEAEERGAELQGLRSAERKGGTIAQDTSKKAFEQVSNIRANVGRLREVVQLVKDGAETGPLSSRLPSFRSESIRLDNLRSKLGLDVVGAVTFGALSKGELDLALSTALPTKLQGPDLIKWANEKIVAQEKLANYMEAQAEFLGVPGNTVSDWIAAVKDTEKAPPKEAPPKEKPADVPRETDEMDDVLIIDSEGFLIP